MSTTADGHTSDRLPTRPTLLRAITDPQNEAAWHEFEQSYRKLIYGLAVQSGLTADEAEEATQETLVSVSQAISKFKYDPKRCSFKTWLGVLAKRRIADQFRKRPPRGRFVDLPPDPSTVTDPVAKLADPASLEPDAFWEVEYEKAVRDAALAKLRQEVKPSHYQIFHLHVANGQPASDVAKALGVRVGQVHLVKLRLQPKFQKIVAGLQKQPV